MNIIQAGVLASALIITELAAADALAPDAANVPYGPHARNVLDVWTVKDAKAPTPLVVFIHGGGFRAGDKSDYEKPQYIQPLLNAGIACASINYRYVLHAPVPDILRDCARAVQLIRSRAKEWNIDPQRIGGWGGSAGACSVLWLGSHDDLANPQSPDPVSRQSSRLSAVVLIATQATLDVTRWASFMDEPRPEWKTKSEEAALSLYNAKSQAEFNTPKMKELLADCDMLRLIGKGDAPVFCVNVVPDGPSKDVNQYMHHPRHAEAIRKACEAAGVPCTVHPGRGQQAELAAGQWIIGQLSGK